MVDAASMRVGGDDSTEDGNGVEKAAATGSGAVSSGAGSAGIGAGVDAASGAFEKGHRLRFRAPYGLTSTAGREVMSVRYTYVSEMGFAGILWNMWAEKAADYPEPQLGSGTMSQLGTRWHSPTSHDMHHGT